MPVYELVDDVYHTYGEDPDATKAGVGVVHVQVQGPPPVQRGFIADPNESGITVDFFNGRCTYDENNPEHFETIRLLNEAVERSAMKGYPPGSVRMVGAEDLKITISQSEHEALLEEIDRLRRGQPRYDERGNMHAREVRVTLTPEEAAEQAQSKGEMVCRVCNKIFKGKGQNMGQLKTHCDWMVKGGKATSKPQEHAVYLAELLRETATIKVEDE